MERCWRTLRRTPRSLRRGSRRRRGRPPRDESSGGSDASSGGSDAAAACGARPAAEARAGSLVSDAAAAWYTLQGFGLRPMSSPRGLNADFLSTHRGSSPKIGCRLCQDVATKSRPSALNIWQRRAASLAEAWRSLWRTSAHDRAVEGVTRGLLGAWLHCGVGGRPQGSRARSRPPGRLTRAAAARGLGLDALAAVAWEPLQGF